MDNAYLTDLIDPDILQMIQDDFSDTMGVAALTTDQYGMPVTEPSNFTDFCMKYTRESEIGQNRCMRCDKSGAEMTLNTKKPYCYYCHAGLMDFAAPIMLGDKIIGSFIGGEVLPAPPDLDQFRKIAQELGIDEHDYIEAVQNVKIIKPSQLQKAADFLGVVGKCLSFMAFHTYELNKSNIELEKASRMKSDFLANMSHEIRTPMNAVIGMVDLALREDMSYTAKKYMHQIKSSAKNLLVIINDILDYSKIESGKMDIINVAYEPLSIINDLSSIAFSRIGTKDIEFTIDVDPDMPQLIFGDNVRIHQILLNLITNAIKFTQQGEVHLAIHYERESDETVIMKAAVNDTGMGIKPQDIEKLFRSFKQVDSKRNRNIEGTGLGLAICKQLLDLMGGKISVKSEFGKGSSFFFEVPQKIIDKTPAIPALTKNIKVGMLVSSGYVRNQLIKDLKRVSAIPVTLSTIDNLDEVEYDNIVVEKSFFTDSIRKLLEKHPEIPCTVIGNFGSPNDIEMPSVKFIQKPVYSLGLYNALGFTNFMLNTAGSEMDDFTFVAPEARVLIVDDNAVNLTVAKGLIEPLHMQVDTAESAAQAIEMVCNIKYDLIFMDHMMPEVDGVEATHIIRRMLPSYNETPIIALTANAVSGAKEMFLAEGMNDFVAKPIEISDIVTKLRKWLPQDKIMPADKFEGGESETPASEMPSIRDIEGLNTEKAISMLGSEKLYWTVLREYYTNIGKNSQSIQDHFDNEEWSEYTIEVHALKSASRQIGAEELGEHAFELEMAGKENNIDLIKKKTAAMLDEYKALTDMLAPMFPDLADVKKGYADRETISEFLDKLREAIGDFDILCIDEIIDEMSSFEYHKTCLDYFDQLKEKIEESDFDACLEIMDKWTGCIEKCQYFSRTPKDVTLNMLKTLQNALNNFDMDQINYAISELSKNQYPQNQQEILEQITDYVKENAIDNCFELVASWRDILK